MVKPSQNGGVPDFEVGIIGGGPAGAACAGYLAKAGISCVVLEREIFPRPHVGESFVPASTRIFRELGFLDQLESNGFPRKYGAAWTSHIGRAYHHDWKGIYPRDVIDIRFSDRPQEGVEQDYTYHVDRAKFDDLFLRHAKKLGATVLNGAAVTDVDFSKMLPEIRFTQEGKRAAYRVRMVVDASGRTTFLGSKLKFKILDPVFNQFAIHTWFEGFDRGHSDQSDFIFVHHLPTPNSWIWQIPISETITSFGVVSQKANFTRTRQSREKFFWDCIATRPPILEKLRNAKQIRPFTEEADYSYAMKQICGDRFVLIGDAARFVDPIFSSGVSIALNCARFASRDIVQAVRAGDFSKERFRTFETLIRRGQKNWHDFISVYYRLNFLFSAFTFNPEYHLDVLKLLQGDMYDEDEPPVLAKMREIVTEVENDPDNVWHERLSYLTAKAFDPGR